MRRICVSWAASLSLAAALLLLSGIGDYLSGDDVAFTLVYIVPVALATWKAGRTPGLLISAAAVLSSFICTRNHLPPLSRAVQFWNLATEFAVFATMASLLADLEERLNLESTRALTDPLTGLLNRRALQEAASVEIARTLRHERPLTVVLLDLDGFKQVNDTLGHESGDMVLKTVAGVLRHRVREMDLLARVGGDEFVLLLPETSASEAATVCSDLMAQVSGSMKENGWPVVGLSIGAATFTSAPRSIADALRVADTLLYEAKRAGKGRVRYETFRG
jgi:diguanylate cyclase (GGDEF)-like protein